MGSSDREILIVFPIPSINKGAKAIVERINPTSLIEVSVTPI